MSDLRVPMTCMLKPLFWAPVKGRGSIRVRSRGFWWINDFSLYRKNVLVLANIQTIGIFLQGVKRTLGRVLFRKVMTKRTKLALEFAACIETHGLLEVGVTVGKVIREADFWWLRIKGVFGAGWGTIIFKSLLFWYFRVIGTFFSNFAVFVLKQNAARKPWGWL